MGSTNTRLFEFAVEVVPGPPETAFRMTKAIILLPKHMVENQTGMDIEIKQLGTSDPTSNALDVQHRCARMLGQNERYVGKGGKRGWENWQHCTQTPLVTINICAFVYTVQPCTHHQPSSPTAAPHTLYTPCPPTPQCPHLLG